MIPNERKLCSYRCAACGDFTFPELPPDPPVREMVCRFCGVTTFVRDLTAEELIELHALLLERRLSSRLVPQEGSALSLTCKPRPHPPADLAPLDCFEVSGK